MTTQARARRGLAIYFACVVVGSGICEGLILRAGGPIESHLVLALLNMWMPGLASLIARIVMREGPGDLSFAMRARTGVPMLALAWVYPVVVGGVAYGLAWATDLERFSAPSFAAFARALGIMLSLGTVLSAISATGEELGWRGYMLTRLIDAGVKRPLVVSGLIWSAWHLPLILSGQYAAGPNRFVSALLFTVSTTAGGVVAGRVRLGSGSIWPAIVFHAAWNAVIQGVFDRFTHGGSASATTSIWIGESGVLVVAADVVFAALVCLRPWPARRRPSEDPMTTFSLRNA